MTPVERDRLAREVVDMRRSAAWLRRRLEATPIAISIIPEIIARESSVDRLLELDARLVVEEVRLTARQDALLDARGEPARQRFEERLQDLAREEGVLRAERARLDARLMAEHRAFVTTRRVLAVRLAFAGLTRVARGFPRDLSQCGLESVSRR